MPVASAAGGEDLRIPLAEAPREPRLVAVTGDALVGLVAGAEDDEVRASNDDGTSWHEAPDSLRRAEWAGDGLVRYAPRTDGDEVTLYTYDLPSRSITDSVTFPATALEAVGRATVVFGNGTEDEDPTMLRAAPVGDPSLAVDLAWTPRPTNYLRQTQLDAGDHVVVATLNRSRGRAATGYLDAVPLAGGPSTYAPATVSGLAGTAMRGDRLYYVVGTSTAAKVCYRSTATAASWSKETCLTVRKGDYRTLFGLGTLTAGPDWASFDLWYGDDRFVGSYVADWSAKPGRVFTVKASGAVKSLRPSRAIGDYPRPLYVARTASGGHVAELTTNGTLVRTAFWPTAPVEPDTLSLAGDRLAGLDDRGSGTAWQRSLGAPASEKVLSGKARQVLVSGTRTAVNGPDGLVLLEGGTKVATRKAWAMLGELSGPYLIGYASSRDRKPTVLAGTKTVSFGRYDYPLALFGSRVATLTFSAYDWWVTVWDVRSGRPVKLAEVSLAGFEEVGGVFLWGDVVAVTGYLSGSDVTMARIRDFVRDEDLWSEPMVGEDWMLTGLGDGFGVLRDDDGDTQLLNWGTGTLTPLPGVGWANPAVDAGRVAYATATELVVHEVPDAGASKPRALWTSAPGSFNSWAGESAAWRLSVDATVPLSPGALVITPDDPSLPRVTVPVPASSDGALRVAWDGRLGDGTWAPAGGYRWELDGFGGLSAIDGTSPVAGVVTVTNTRTAYPQATPRIDNTRPRTGKVLTADPGRYPADVTPAYQWYRSGRAIKAATVATYVVQAGDVGKKLSVKVTFSGSQHYTRTSRTSTSTAKVAKGTLVAGTVATRTSAPVVGTAVSGVAEGWGPEPVKVAWQWYRVSATGKAVAIPRATGQAYTPTVTDRGHRLKVRAGVSRAGYTPQVGYSPVTDVVPAG